MDFWEMGCKNGFDVDEIGSGYSAYGRLYYQQVKIVLFLTQIIRAK
jgi:hypothetical protein